MCDLENYQIDLKNLRAEQQTFSYHVDSTFFKAIGAQDVERGEVDATVRVTKVAGSFSLAIHVQGTVIIPCDLCLDDMDQPVEAGHQLTVTLGDEYSEEDDTVTVDERTGIIDTSWFIYEQIILAIPIKHVHAPGKCNPAMVKALEEHSATRSGGGERTVDPRWSELEKLKTTFND